MNRLSTVLLVVVIVLEVLSFTILCFAMPPLHIVIHSLLVFLLLKDKNVQLALTPNKFAVLTSFLPFAFIFIILLLTLVFSWTAFSAQEMIGMLAYSFAICLLEFLSAKFQYKRWLDKNLVVVS